MLSEFDGRRVSNVVKTARRQHTVSSDKFTLRTPSLTYSSLLSFIVASMNDHPPESTNDLDLTGQTVGEYYLIRRLGRGGMADVFLAEQQSLKRNVALKILKPELARDDSYVRRFQLEAQAAAALVQANIVQIYEVNECDGLHFISQEYVPGRNLRQYIERYSTLR